MAAAPRRLLVFACAMAAVAAACSSGGDNVVAPAAATAAPSVTEPADTEPADTEPEVTEPAIPTDPVVTATTSISSESTAPEITAANDRAAPAGRCDVDGATPGELVVWLSLGGEAAPQHLDRSVQAFEAAYPGMAVRVETRNETAGERTAAFAALTPEDRPHIIMGSQGTVRLQHDSGNFVLPAECTGGETPDTLRDLLPVVEHTYSIDGQLVAAPFNVSAPVLMFDRNRWRLAGLDPDQPPATFDEFELVVRALADSDAVSHGLVLYDKSASWFIEQRAAQLGELLVSPANGHDGTDISTVDFNVTGAVKVLDALSDLRNEGALLWIGLNPGGNADLLTLAQGAGSAGATLHSSAALGDVFTLLETGAVGDGTVDFGTVDVGVAPFPGPQVGSTPGGGALWLTAHSDPAVVGRAWQLVEWLTEPEQVAELAAATGYIPTTERAAASQITVESWAERPQLRVAYDQIAVMPGTDAAAGLQVGPQESVWRELELAAAYAIDVDSDPVYELNLRSEAAQQWLDMYADLQRAAGTDG